MKNFFAVAALLVAATSANASITVFLDGVTLNSPMAGVNTFEYRVEQTQGDEMRNNDYFTIYDIGGFVNAVAPAGFTATAQNPGLNPPAYNAIVNDGPLINVTFTRTGGTTQAQNIDGFLIRSTVSSTVLDDFFGQNTKTNIGTKNNATGNVFVPAAVPEPATMGLMGGALLGLGFLARRRKA
jgi:hypothetical protein